MTYLIASTFQRDDTVDEMFALSVDSQYVPTGYAGEKVRLFQ